MTKLNCGVQSKIYCMDYVTYLQHIHWFTYSKTSIVKIMFLLGGILIYEGRTMTDRDNYRLLINYVPHNDGAFLLFGGFSSPTQ